MQCCEAGARAGGGDGDTNESFVPENWATDRAPERTAPAAETVAEAADDSTDAVGRRAA